MKKNIYLTIIWIVTIFCIVAGSCYHIWGENFLDDFHFTGDFGKHETYSGNIEAFDSISLDVDLAEVNIIAGDAWNLSYECTRNVAPDFKVEQGVLYVKQTSKKSHFLIRNGNDDCDIVITIPRDAGISRISGNCNLGDLEFEGVAVEEIDVECNLGEIALKDLNASSITCSCNLGDCEIANCSFDNLKVDNDMGSIEVYSRNPLSDYMMDLSVSMGSIEVNGNDYVSSYYQQQGKEGKSIILTNNMGSIEVEDK